MTRPRGTDSARVIQVIETKALRGEGTNEDMCRIVTQYWNFEGKLLAEYDPGQVRRDEDYEYIVELCGKEVSRCMKSPVR